ncbi:DUF3313 family protein [Lentisphaerota bacterium WC36G]|nr:DUF3313 domain-containing protein [Lentisphaerae bacterium WC36]
MKFDSKLSLKIFLLVFLGICISGCRSKQIESNIYLKEKALSKIDPQSESIKDRIWFDKKIKNFDKVQVNVQLTPEMIEGSFMENVTTRELFYSKDNDFNYVKEYVKESFKNSFNNSRHFKLVNENNGDSLVLNFYITQIIRGKPVLGAIGNISSFTPIGLILLPIKLGVKGISDEHGGVIAMETTICDSQQNLYAVIVDRQKGSVALFNLKDFTTYGNIRTNINQWTKNIVNALDAIKDNYEVEFSQIDTFKFIDYE